MTQDYILARLLANNAQWAEDVEKAEPGFLADLAKQQTPKVSPASLRFVTEPLVPRYANICICCPRHVIWGSELHYYIEVRRLSGAWGGWGRRHIHLESIAVVLVTASTSGLDTSRHTLSVIFGMARQITTTSSLPCSASAPDTTRH